MSSEKTPIELPLDAHGRPYLPPDATYALALENGYEGADGKDLGAAVRPEDVGSFGENAARIDQPAHFEQVSITPPVERNGGYTALNAPNPVTPNITVDEALAIAKAAEVAERQRVQLQAYLVRSAVHEAASVEVASEPLAEPETIVTEPVIPAPPSEAVAAVIESSTEGVI